MQPADMDEATRSVYEWARQHGTAKQKRKAAQALAAEAESAPKRTASHSAAPSAPARGAFTSHLATVLITLWCWHCLSASAVQRVAHAAYKDGLTHEEIRRLAKLGNWGATDKNLARDLRRAMGMRDMPKATNVKTWLGGFKVPPRAREVFQPIMLPHLWFAHIYHNFQDAFIQLFRGANGYIQEFWAGVRGQPKFQNHEVQIST